MLAALHERLVDHGFDHYEISNLARSGYRCRHNQTYWDGVAPWLGFGMSATSFWHGQRRSRPRTVPAYLRWVAAGCDQNQLLVEYDAVQSSWAERLAHHLFLRLRRREGIDLSAFARQFGPAATDVLRTQASYQPKLLHLDSRVLKLTQPSGFLLADHILSNLLAAFPEEEA